MADSKKIDSVSTTLQLKEQLQEKEQKLSFRDDLFGAVLLTNPGLISSSRNIMFTSHLRQFVNLNNPDIPKVMTNYENIVGKYSTGYYQAKSELEVIDIIPKFQNGKTDSHIYLMFIYNKHDDKYDVIEKRVVEDLTEKFGFEYDNRVMDSKKVGDTIPKGEVLYKTVSYDDDMNYRYGKNVKFMYLLDNDTIEDAIKISRSLADSMESKEVERVRVTANDNDIFCNLFGKDNDDYKIFPNIGEYVKGKIVCAKRRIHNNQLLYDAKKSNLRKINFSSDVPYFCEGRVVDIDIYCNKPIEEIEDNNFNAQIIEYLRMQENFYRRVYERCREIISSGSEYSNDINFYYKKAKNILDENYKWREEDGSVFNNLVIEFLIERNIPLSVGQKLTGRYGNKGVISKIVPDEEMPVLENGERVHIIFNSLGVVNRLNSQQLFEQSITFICNRVAERMVTLDTSHAAELLLRTIWYFNEDQANVLEKYLASLSGKQLTDFIDGIKRSQKIYVHIPPLWEKEALFDRLWKLYDEFDWIEPYRVYVQKFGRKIEIMKRLVVGDMYVIKLKQTSKKGFSARSTGSLSKKGVPEKSNKAKTHQELYSKTPIRIGDQENVNSAIGVSTNLIAQLHLFYRSSPIARRQLGEKLMTKIKEIEDFTYQPEFTNRNVEILQAYLKAMGLKIEFSDERYVIDLYTDKLETFESDDRMYICSREEYEDISLKNNIRRKYREDQIFIGSPDEFEELVEKEFQEEKARQDRLVIKIDIPKGEKTKI